MKTATDWMLFLVWFIITETGENPQLQRIKNHILRYSHVILCRYILDLRQTTDLNKYSRLVVRVCGEGLCLLRWDGGISLDKHSHDPSSSFDAQRERCHIQKQKILDVL